METGVIKTKLCTEGANFDQSHDQDQFDPLKQTR